MRQEECGAWTGTLLAAAGGAVLALALTFVVWLYWRPEADLDVTLWP